jgi:hypothetical protein
VAPRRIAVLLVGLATLSAGCGGDDRGDEQAIKRVLTTYLSAVAAADGRQACARLTENAQLGVFEFKRAHAGTDHPAEACADTIRRHAPGGRARLRARHDVTVRVDGDRADATVDGYEVKLERHSGQWKIATFGLAGDVAGGPLRTRRD